MMQLEQTGVFCLGSANLKLEKPEAVRKSIVFSNCILQYRNIAEVSGKPLENQEPALE